MDKHKYLEKYFNDLRNVINFDSDKIKNLIEVSEVLLKANRKGKKTRIFGNGGSAAIASHFSIDCNNKLKIKCLNFNEASILTCFSNDYGYENWVKKALEQFSEKGDLVILISSSGESKNMIFASKFTKIKKIKTVTLTGFNKKNTLSKSGYIDIWINSKVYNFVENSHQIILLSIIDSISNLKIK